MSEPAPASGETFGRYQLLERIGQGGMAEVFKAKAFGVEGFDFVLPRSIWFRRLFQDLLGRLQTGECRQVADMLGGYDFSESGEMIWGQE